MAESVKKKYIEILGLNDKFTQKELELAYKKSIRNLAQLPNLKREYFIMQVMLHNTAASILSDSSLVNNLENAFSEKTCNKLGITLEEAKLIFKRKVELSGVKEEFSTWLEKRRANQELYEDVKEDAIRIYNEIPQMLLMRYDRLVSIYEGDKELSETDITFASWIKSLTQLCKFMIEKDNQLVLEKEYQEYIFYSSLGKSFLSYLSNKVLEMDLCKQLGISYYEAKHNYDFKVSGISFRKYLEELLEFRDTLAKLDITKEKFKDFYAKYKEEGYTGSELEFLRELEQSLDYCIDINCGYFILKRRYEELPKEEKPSRFIDWLEIEEVSYKLGGYAKILDAIYEKQVESGYTGTKIDLFKILTGLKPIEKENQSMFSSSKK